jgi:hypothetical protein
LPTLLDQVPMSSIPARLLVGSPRLSNGEWQHRRSTGGGLLAVSHSGPEGRTAPRRTARPARLWPCAIARNCDAVPCVWRDGVRALGLRMAPHGSARPSAGQTGHIVLPGWSPSRGLPNDAGDALICCGDRRRCTDHRKPITNRCCPCPMAFIYLFISGGGGVRRAGGPLLPSLGRNPAAALSAVAALQRDSDVGGCSP